MSKGMGRNDDGVIDISEPGITEGWLWGFDIDSAGLKVKHRSWLDSHVVPVLQGGGSVAITGLTSRSGAAAHNLALSKRRASAVLAYLRKNVRRFFAVKSVTGAGERWAEANYRNDGTEEKFYRAVQVSAWPKPTPPPPPKPTSVAQRLRRRGGALV